MCFDPGNQPDILTFIPDCKLMHLEESPAPGQYEIPGSTHRVQDKEDLSNFKSVFGQTKRDIDVIWVGEKKNNPGPSEYEKENSYRLIKPKTRCFAVFKKKHIDGKQVKKRL